MLPAESGKVSGELVAPGLAGTAGDTDEPTDARILAAAFTGAVEFADGVDVAAV